MGRIASRLVRVIRPTPQEARAAVQAVAAWLAAHGVHQDDIGSVQIALAEAVNNVVEHGACSSRDHIRVTARIRCRRGVIIEICDSGRGLPNGETPQGHFVPPAGSAADLPEGGYGWHLIKELTARVQYRRRENCNTLVLEFATQTR